MSMTAKIENVFTMAKGPESVKDVKILCVDKFIYLNVHSKYTFDIQQSNNLVAEKKHRQIIIS